MLSKRFFLAGLLVLIATGAAGQTPDSESEAWLTFNAAFDLRPRLRLQISEELKNGAAQREWSTAVMLSHRVKRLVKFSGDDPDEEKQYNLVLGTGYEYLHTNENGNIKNEHRLPIQATARHEPGLGLLLTDRNRIEFRWVNGAFDFRYRNKPAIERAFKAGSFRFTPYASGELFYDRNHHSWNENQYAFGVQLPYKKVLQLDTYYLHQNCTTCSPSHVNAFGLTVTWYIRRIKK